MTGGSVTSKSSALKRRFVIALWVAAVLAIVIVWQSDWIMPLQSVDNLYLSAAKKEAIWSGENPSTEEVEAYLSGKTFVISMPPIGNSAYYFSKNHDVFAWHGIEVAIGTWTVTSHIVPMIYNNRFKFRIVSHLCKIFLTQPESNQDNCHIVRNLDDIFYGDLSIANGDPLDLQNPRRQRQPMPTTKISVGSLSDMMPL